LTHIAQFDPQSEREIAATAVNQSCLGRVAHMADHAVPTDAIPCRDECCRSRDVKLVELYDDKRS